MDKAKRRQLQLAVESTAAIWAAFMESKKEDWALGDSFGLDSGEQQQLLEFINRKKNRRWMKGAGSGTKPRSRRSAQVREQLGCSHLYLFSNQEPVTHILVGAQARLTATGRRFFQALSLTAPDRSAVNGESLPGEDAQEFYRLMEQVGSSDVAELDLETLVQRFAGRALELARARGVELGLVDSRNQVLRVLHSELDGVRQAPYALEMGSGLMGSVVHTRQPVLLMGADDWQQRAWEHPWGGGSPAIAVPLFYKGRVIGVLAVFGQQSGHAFGNADIRWLSLLAGQISISIRNARLFQDLSEQIKAQKITEKKIAEAARLTAIGEMAASVAHELNNPLTTITGFTELVLEDSGPDFHQRGDLELVLQEARRAREVVRRLLDFSRQGEKSNLPVDLNEAVSEVVALVQSMAQVQGIELQFELWQDLPAVVGDQNQIKQVLLNLVNNGIYAMSGGGKLVLQTLSETRGSERWVRIRVCDQGTGITDENLPLIFQPFFTTKPIGSGTGLGLSISKNIIAEHGGEIVLEETTDHGSVFSVWLPAMDGRTEAAG
jgi:signal transduction histidine kinase